MKNLKLGTLYGISVGTGDPELITVKALHLLQTTKIIAFPVGINNKPGVAQQIIQQWLQPDQIIVPLDFPYVRDRAVLESAWYKSANIVWQYLQQGQDVAFACEGDISFYSTFTHLATTLKQLYPSTLITIIPGVCSLVAAASNLGIPLTIYDQRLTVLPALYTIEQLETALDNAEVVVLLKVNSVYQQVWQILQQRNLLEHSFVVEKATYSDRKIYQNLVDYPDLKLSYFSILIAHCYKNTEFASI
jgi:precorrin-2/cobalt-factor-2 C20-methyltransferase